MTLNNQNKIELNQNSLQKIREIESPISVLSVIGPYRSGKSFLMNMLSGNYTKFETGSSTNPCTQGVWIDIIPPKTNTNESYKILMDTEGLFSFNRDENFDMTLFLFTTLASCVMIYNSLGVIDEKALEQFAFLTNIAKVFASHSSEKNNESRPFDLNHDLKQLFPHFIWVLRDFTLDLQIGDDGQMITPDEYLEYALMTRPKAKNSQIHENDRNSRKPDGYPQYRNSFGRYNISEQNENEKKYNSKQDFNDFQSKKDEYLKNSGLSNFADLQKNLIRKAIKSFFHSRSCFTLIRPVNDERILQKIEQADKTQIKEHFMDEIGNILDHLQKYLKPKKVKDMILNGEAFANLLVQITDALNSTAMPKIESIIVL